MYLVELGDIEVTATLRKHGKRDQGLEPVFDIDAGTDWDGTPVYLDMEDQRIVSEWIISNYSSEVYT